MSAENREKFPQTEPPGGMSSAERASRLSSLAPREKLAALDLQAELGGGQDRVEEVPHAGKLEALYRNEPPLGAGTYLSPNQLTCHRGDVFRPANNDFIV